MTKAQLKRALARFAYYLTEADDGEGWQVIDIRNGRSVIGNVIEIYDLPRVEAWLRRLQRRSERAWAAA